MQGCKQKETARVLNWQLVTFIYGLNLLCRHSSKTVYTLLSEAIAGLQEDFNLSMPQVGALQSAVLCGYMFGQVGQQMLSFVVSSTAQL